MTSSGHYEAEILPGAEKDINALKGNAAQAVHEILKPEHDPLLGHPLKGSLRGSRALEFNLKGGGDYRAVYTLVEDERICVVFLVGSHENIYKQSERRYAALRRTER